MTPKPRDVFHAARLPFVLIRINYYLPTGYSMYGRRFHCTNYCRRSLYLYSDSGQIKKNIFLYKKLYLLIINYI